MGPGADVNSQETVSTALVRAYPHASGRTKEALECQHRKQ